MGQISIQQKQTERLSQLQCFLVFFIILLPLMYWVTQLKTNFRSPFHIFLFISGWFSWTFIEYISHRFWSHSKTSNKKNAVIRRHQHHHSHPTDIKVTGRQRLVMSIIAALLIVFSILLDNYLTFLAGFWMGIFWFFQMHYFLHQSWVKKVFPQLLKYHIVHHCRQPDRCFGISTIWWDKVFGTIPSGKTSVSQRIIEFYFNHPH
ncbi:MAG TPA: sterol desaturase family protein [Puia sp.]|nr:sterol desaturase family protein [Puia sp.]